MELIIIDEGDMFEGTVDQFKDCFFDNADHDTIKWWCEDEGFSFRTVSIEERIDELKQQLKFINDPSILISERNYIEKLEKMV